MRSIWKYELSVKENILTLPLGSIIRYVGSQDGGGCMLGGVCMWVEVDPECNQTEEVVLNVVGTGWKAIMPNDVYVGTAQVGAFVWHVYERKQDE